MITQTDPNPPPQLDETCDRIVAALTRRLAQAAELATTPMHIEAPAASHDFLVSIPCPEFSDVAAPTSCH